MGIRVLAVAEVVNILDLERCLLVDVPRSDGAKLINRIVLVAVGPLVLQISPVSGEGEHPLRGGVACNEVEAVCVEGTVLGAVLHIAIAHVVAGVEPRMVVDAGAEALDELLPIKHDLITEE